VNWWENKFGDCPLSGRTVILADTRNSELPAEEKWLVPRISALSPRSDGERRHVKRKPAPLRISEDRVRPRAGIDQSSHTLRPIIGSARNFHRILVGMGGCHGENFNYQSLPVGPF